MRKLLVILIAFLLIDITPVKAEGGAYQLKDAASGQYLSGYDTYSLTEANSYFEALMSSYENLLIMKDDEVIRMERGLVTFHGNEGCTLNTEFKNAYSGGDNYVNGCYGFDSAYIDSDGNKVTFFMAGIMGVVDRSLVTLVPYEELNHPVSSYMVKGGRLIHRIKGDFKSDSFIGYVDLNTSPAYLEEGIYYSYDGHYFYENLKALLEDYRYDTRRNAINSEPYYNYYQYVSHRSYTQIPLEDLEQYFYEDLNLSGEMAYYVDKNRDSVSDVLNKSQFYNNIDSFYHYQYQLGSNAVMMLSLATLESGSGRSSLAYGRNNMFGHAAYDNSVEKSASRYYNVANSIYSHANNYINAAYCYPGNFAYHGGFFGNKSNGMNVSYASDPYWSEKAAGNYAKYDEVCGYKDLNAQTIGIVTENKVVDVYLYPNNTQVLYSTNGEKDFAFMLIDQFSNEYGNWYIIQADPIIQNEVMVERGIYDFANNIAYIHEDAIGYILKGSNFSNVIKNITFDAGEGLFRDGSHMVSIPYKIGDTVTYESPFLAGHEFVGWNQEGDVYEALYKSVRSIKLINEPKSEYEINDRIYLKDLMLEVTYKDGYSKQIPVTTEMVSGYDFREIGEQEVKISYGGYALTYPITVSQELDDIRQQNKTLIAELLSDYENINSLTSSDKERIKEVHQKTKTSVFPDITFVQLKNFDALVKSYDERNFVIEENDYDLGVSGLSLNVIEESDLFFADQLKLSIGKDEVDDTVKKMITTYGYEQVDCFNIHLYHNFKEVNNEEDLIFSIDLPQHDEYTEYQVWEIKGEDILQLQCKQTLNDIHFRSIGTGKYVLIKKNSYVSYVADNYKENITKANCGEDKLASIGKGILLLGIVGLGLLGVIIILLLNKLRQSDDIEIHRHKKDKVSKENVS